MDRLWAVNGGVELRSREVIQKALEELDGKVRGSCPNDPYYPPCEPITALRALLWALGEIKSFTVETNRGMYRINMDGSVDIIEHYRP